MSHLGHIEPGSRHLLRVGMSPDAPPDTEADGDGAFGYAHSYESSSRYDGPGLRVVLFVSGCLLRCSYCHNPDTWHLKDGAYIAAQEVIDRLGDFAPALLALDGGLTISGGEPMVQLAFTKRILAGAKKLGLHTAIETSGYLGDRVDDDYLANLDLVLLDIKSSDPETYRRTTERELAPTLRFAERLGAIFATTVASGSISGTIGADGAPFTASLPYGIMRLVIGVVFSLGLILVVVGGAELFTGNNLIVIAWASGRVRTQDLLANWLVAFCGNAIGAALTAILMFLTTQYTFGGGAVGFTALMTAKAKVELGLVPALTLGIMCNTLVCLAVWMCYSARTTAGRIITIVPPIAAFVAAGFEHSIANIYFLTIGLSIKYGAPETFWQAIRRTPDDFASLTWRTAVFDNLAPVTVGNVIGGSVMVAAVYWFIYLRKASDLNSR
ncbi:formate/nitrite transporter family protein [Rhodoblastus sp.]|uniref:formate/nitrite transporter family protein n=1 Tax=Rhodoblastus sp. TaxID=1962975 RepID=UPI0035B1129D